MIYLFIGEDEFSKDLTIEKIKQQLFPSEIESFNFEILYSKELSLNTLQEKLLVFPIKAKQRLILIKDIARLRPNIKEYLVSYTKNPFSHVSLILDTRLSDKKDAFFKRIFNLVKVIQFHSSIESNAFVLARQALQKKIKPALKTLHQLLLQGEKPERILGAIRYQLNQERLSLEERKNKLTVLLNCDIDIKTGRLKPEFALERLLLSLSCF